MTKRIGRTAPRKKPTRPLASDDENIVVEDESTIIADGQKAWQDVRSRTHTTFADWLTIGRALRLGRRRAMEEAGAPRPEGSAYNRVYGQWLREHGFTLDKSDRAKLLNVSEREYEIVAWRESLPESEQLKLIHPATVWRRYAHTHEPFKGKNTKRERAQAAEADAAVRSEKAEARRMTSDPQLNAQIIMEMLREEFGGQAAELAIRTGAELIDLGEAEGPEEEGEDAA